MPVLATHPGQQRRWSPWYGSCCATCPFPPWRACCCRRRWRHLTGAATAEGRQALQGPWPVHSCWLCCRCVKADVRLVTSTKRSIEWGGAAIGRRSAWQLLTPLHRLAVCVLLAQGSPIAAEWEHQAEELQVGAGSNGMVHTLLNAVMQIPVAPGDPDGLVPLFT